MSGGTGFIKHAARGGAGARGGNGVRLAYRRA